MSHRVESTADTDIAFFPFDELTLRGDLFFFEQTDSVLLLKIPGAIIREPAQPALGGKKRLRVHFLNAHTQESFQRFSAQFLARAAAIVHETQSKWLGSTAANDVVSLECLRDMFLPIVPVVASSPTDPAYLPLTIGADPVLCYDHDRVPLQDVSFLHSAAAAASSPAAPAPKHVILLAQPRLMKSNPEEPIFRIELLLLQCMVIPPPPIDVSPSPPPPLQASFFSAPPPSDPLITLAAAEEDATSVPLTSPLPPFGIEHPHHDEGKYAIIPSGLPSFSSIEDLQDEINGSAIHSEEFLMDQVLASLDAADAATAAPPLPTLSSSNGDREERKRKLKEAERRCRAKMRELVRLQTEVLDLKKAYLAVSDAMSVSDSSSSSDGEDAGDDVEHNNTGSLFF